METGVCTSSPRVCYLRYFCFSEFYIERPALDSPRSREMVSLVKWAKECQTNGQSKRIIDPNLVGKIRPDSLGRFGETAVKCLAETGVDWPSMGEVLQKLDYALHL